MLTTIATTVAQDTERSIQGPIRLPKYLVAPKALITPPPAEGFRILEAEIKHLDPQVRIVNLEGISDQMSLWWMLTLSRYGNESERKFAKAFHRFCTSDCDQTTDYTQNQFFGIMLEAEDDDDLDVATNFLEETVQTVPGDALTRTEYLRSVLIGPDTSQKCLEYFRKLGLI